MATVVRDAALAGDSKAAMDILKHRHDWVAKQQIQVDTTQQISISLALEQANARVANAQTDVIDVEPASPRLPQTQSTKLTIPDHAAAEIRTG